MSQDNRPHRALRALRWIVEQAWRWPQATTLVGGIATVVGTAGVVVEHVGPFAAVAVAGVLTTAATLGWARIPWDVAELEDDT